MTNKNRYELLAPVGNEEMFYSAIASGADAIYMAGNRFGARAYASNFKIKEIQDMIKYAHLRGIKVYITVNTLIKDDELEELYKYIKTIYLAGVDAIIIQDYGLYNMAKKYFPNLELHSSTQMAVNNLQGAKKLEDMKIDRLVVGRETSLLEIEKIHQLSNIEIEAFIHGSLCVAVSGQCYISSLIGGRSGNRGRCAQPCRKLYDIYLDNGEKINTISDSFISGRDLMLIEEIESMKKIGVYSYKIEGRMKKPEYVYNTVKQYKKALSNQIYDKDSFSMVSNRKFTKGLAFGEFGKEYYNSISHISGEKIGEIIRTSGPFLLANKKLNKGDIISVKSSRGNRFNLTLTEDIDMGKRWNLNKYPDLEIGSQAYRIFSQDLVNELKEGLEKDYRRKIQIDISIKSGSNIKGIVKLDGQQYTINSNFMVEEAKNRPLTQEKIKEQLSRLGNTIYEVDQWNIDLEENVFIPLSSLNDYRRQIVEVLDKSFTSFYRENEIKPYKPIRKNKIDRKNQLSYEYIREFNKKINFDLIDRVYTHDFTSIRELKKYYRGPVYFIFPRIMDEEDYQKLKSDINQNLSLIDGFSINSLGDLYFVESHYKKEIHLEAWMNVMNSEAVDFFTNQGVTSISLSHEINKDEIESLKYLDMEFEIQAYGSIAQMLMKYCPASAIKGCKDDSNCKSCNYRKNIYLHGEKDRLPFIRNVNYTEVLTDKNLNLLSSKEVDMNFGLFRIVDREEENIHQVIEDFYYIFIEGKEEIKNKYSKQDYILGNYNKGVL